MKVKHILGITLDKESGEALDCLLLERVNSLNKILRKNIEPKESGKRYEELEALVMEHYSKDQKECEEFLNWIVGHEGEGNEDFYLYGIKDGIRAAKWFLSL